MALVVKDRVKETSTTSGTGTLTLAGAADGFQAFSAIGDGNTTYYAIVDSTTGDWEVGLGTYNATGTELVRNEVLESSNSGSFVSLAGNSVEVFCTYPAEKAVLVDGATMTGDLKFGDNKKAIFGNDDDFQIQYDGSNNVTYMTASTPYITVDAATAVVFDTNIQPNTADNKDSGTQGFPWRTTYTNNVYNDGAMTIRGGGYVYLQTFAGEQMVRCTENAGVELFYNNDLKLNTTSTGVDVTGALTVNGSPLEAGAKEGVFWENSQEVTSSYTITSGKNAGTFGDITINSGVSVTVPTGSTWTIV